MKKLLAAAVLALLPVAALQAMPVETFLQKAEALQRRGILALASSDYRLLRGEVQTATAALRAERQAAQRAGRQPAYCPPQQGGSLTPADILGHFRTIPAPQRARMEVRDGLRTLLARRFPCRR
jgi:hypothetical protein